MREWYYVKNKEQVGPVSEADLVTLLSSGTIPADTQVWTEGMDTWATASAVEELALSETPQSLNPLASPLTTSSLPPPESSQVRPWVRYWARLLDVYLLSAVFYMGIIAVGLRMETPHLFFAGMFLPMAWLFLEPIFISTYGATPGKLLMRVRVTGQDGELLTYADALTRSVRVWFFGEALHLPVIPLFTYIAAYNKLSNKGITSWDKKGNHLVSHQKIGGLRIFAVILLIIIANVVSSSAVNAI